MGSLLRSYVKVLKEVRYETSQVKIVNELFKSAGAKKEPFDDTINSWLRGKSKCRVEDYFDEGKISAAGKQGIINYFLSKSYIPWKELQNKFISNKVFKCVDCETEDQMQFYQSLLNEFLRCLNLPIEISEKHKELKPSEESEEDKVAKNIDELISKIGEAIFDDKFPVINGQNIAFPEFMTSSVNEFLYGRNIPDVQRFRLLNNFAMMEELKRRMGEKE